MPSHQGPSPNDVMSLAVHRQMPRLAPPMLHRLLPLLRCPSRFGQVITDDRASRAHKPQQLRAQALFNEAIEAQEAGTWTRRARS